MKKFLNLSFSLNNVNVLRIIASLLAGFVFVSCNDELDLDNSSTNNSELPIHYLSPQHDALRKEFGQMLMSAVINEVGVRELIKSEALKMFNNDYEVLYHMVKDQKVDSERTFRRSVI